MSAVAALSKRREWAAAVEKKANTKTSKHKKGNKTKKQKAELSTFVDAVMETSTALLPLPPLASSRLSHISKRSSDKYSRAVVIATPQKSLAVSEMLRVQSLMNNPAFTSDPVAGVCAILEARSTASVDPSAPMHIK